MIAGLGIRHRTTFGAIIIILGPLRAVGNVAVLLRRSSASSVPMPAARILDRQSHPPPM
ncbi:MAG: hypothetical protein V3T38_06300 [Gammaproteobacteria bacterium]